MTLLEWLFTQDPRLVLLELALVLLGADVVAWRVEGGR